MEVEDDLLFANLNKQISLLIMDDDDEHPVIVHTPSVTHQVFSHPPNGFYYPCESASKRSSVSKVTGVFIPARSLYKAKKLKQEHGNLKSSQGVTSRVSSNHSFQPRKG